MNKNKMNNPPQKDPDGKKIDLNARFGLILHTVAVQVVVMMKCEVQRIEIFCRYTK